MVMLGDGSDISVGVAVLAGGDGAWPQLGGWLEQRAAQVATDPPGVGGPVRHPAEEAQVMGGEPLGEGAAHGGEVPGERPGADLMEAPRTVPLPLALVGITVAALAEAMQVRAANELPDHLGDVITTYAQTLSGFGQVTADAAPKQADNPAEPARRD